MGRFHSPGLKYVDIKKELIDVIWDFFELYRDRRKNIFSDDEVVIKILKKGAEKAREVASTTLSRARQNIGLLNQ